MLAVDDIVVAVAVPVAVADVNTVAAAGGNTQKNSYCLVV